ncbi:MAG: lactonase family protein [Rhodothermaceae bacterium]|nr:lactonase family protein [Rhodothermaceae bacterium]
MKHPTNRRAFIKYSALGLAGTSLSSSLLSCEDSSSQPEPAITMLPLYIGTYTNKESEGIYRALFNPASGELTDFRLAAPASNPSFLAIHPQKTHLYSVNEVTDYEGAPSGAVSAFSMQQGGELEHVNSQATQGGAPCYISMDAHGRWVLTANYGGGNVALFPVLENGQLSEASSLIQHEGSSVHPRRQQGPHAHCIVLDKSDRYAYAADLGIDKVMIYQLDQEQGQLIPNNPPFVEMAPGAGPRHFAFHPDGVHAFAINELDSTITAFGFDETTGALNPISTASTLPSDFQGTNSCADIHIHPSGRHVYGSNRGHDSIAVMEFDAPSGTLGLVATEPTQGETPRNFCLDPTGQYLLVANQQTDTIVSFSIDAETGLLSSTGHMLNAPTPVCLKFV